ncbi:hypothetical protein PL81_03840, partial [Streptomyces sp. RSD-27]
MAEELRPGDYLRTGYGRFTPEHQRTGEVYTRIEHVEHCARPAFLDREAGHHFTRGMKTLVVVHCQGVPGPILLRAGDHHIARSIPADRQRHDERNPTWPAEHRPLTVGGTRPDAPDRRRPHPRPPQAEPPETPRGLPIARRAASFTKPAGALAVGDYLRTQNRHPADDLGTDEGFHRVEWIAHLEGQALAGLLNEPGWAGGRAVLATVYGIPGVLLLPETTVRVLVAPNAERVAYDQREHWRGGPFLLIKGATTPDPAAQQNADGHHRPPPPEGEADLYPTRFPDPFERTLHLDGRTGTRLVPTAA